jgi:hypothetical protein
VLKAIGVVATLLVEFGCVERMDTDGPALLTISSSQQPFATREAGLGSNLGSKLRPTGAK